MYIAIVYKQELGDKNVDKLRSEPILGINRSNVVNIALQNIHNAYPANDYTLSDGLNHRDNFINRDYINFLAIPKDSPMVRFIATIEIDEIESVD